MTVTQKTTHVVEGLAKLLGQFSGSVNLRNLLTILLTQVQSIENDVAAVAAGLTVSTATNYQLDIIGAIVGEPRAGRTDASYRPRILSRIGINISNGHPDEILEILTATLGHSVTLTEYAPAAFEIYTLVADPSVLADVVSVLTSLRPAGVSGYFTWHPSGTVFQYDGAAGTGYDGVAQYSNTTVS
jgi:hypothetical protein